MSASKRVLAGSLLGVGGLGVLTAVVGLLTALPPLALRWWGARGIPAMFVLYPGEGWVETSGWSMAARLLGWAPLLAISAALLVLAGWSCFGGADRRLGRCLALASLEPALSLLGLAGNAAALDWVGGVFCALMAGWTAALVAATVDASWRIRARGGSPRFAPGDRLVVRRAAVSAASATAPAARRRRSA